MKGNTNIIKEKSFEFALRIINAYKLLVADKKKFVMSKQLLRSGTAVGALYRETEFAESKNNFIHKMVMAQKECNETLYWIELLHKSEYFDKKGFESIHLEAIELIKLITSIIKSAKQNIKH